MFGSSLVRAYSATGTKRFPRSFEELPCVPGGLPYLGSFMKLGANPHGWKQPMENLKILQEKYDPQGNGLLRMSSRLMNPKGDGRILAFFDPKDIEIAYKHEGKHPSRGGALAPLVKWRLSRPDIFGETKGVLMEEGEKWHQLRGLVQQDLMRPKSAMQHLDQIQGICQDFLEMLEREMSSSKDGKTVRGLLPHLFNFGFEGSAAIALDKRMGVFRENPHPEVMKQLREIEIVTEMSIDLMMGIPWYQISPFISPKYRKFVRHFDSFAYYVKVRKNLKENEKTK